MEYEKLKTAGKAVTLSPEQKRRIVRNCKIQLEHTGKETPMKTNRNRHSFRKSAIAAAALAICLSLSLSMTAMAANGTLGGIFRDAKNPFGAIVGTTYEQATDEIKLHVTATGDELTALATIVDPGKLPYSESEKLGIAAYRIVDVSGKTVQEGTTAAVPILNGQAAIGIALDGIDSGSYKLVITAFVSEKKADQPLPIHGSWECSFVK